MIILDSSRGRHMQLTHVSQMHLVEDDRSRKTGVRQLCAGVVRLIHTAGATNQRGIFRNATSLARNIFMTILLPQLRTVVMTMDWFRERQARVRWVLRSLGFQNVEWVCGRRSKPYWRAIRRNVARVLASHTCPFLFLEDDVALMPENYHSDVEVPANTDIFYLGGTLNAENYTGEPPGLIRKPGGVTPWPLTYVEHDENHIQIFNMHSTHAILFLTETAKNGFLSSIARYPDTPVDVCFAREMGRWQTLLVKRPFWHQDDGHNNQLTLEYYEPRRSGVGLDFSSDPLLPTGMPSGAAHSMLEQPAFPQRSRASIRRR